MYESDISIVVATLLDIAKQASALGVGLQNAAPGNETGIPNNTVQYLTDISETLINIAEECKKINLLSK